MNMTMDQFYRDWEEREAAKPIEDGKRVLLVEDDPFWQRVIARNIRHATDSCKITYVTTADEAIAMLDMDRQFHLIIADQFLDSEMTGYDLWRECQKRGFNVPFLLTSGNADLSDQAFQGDPILFVPKPFVAAELRRNLSDLLNVNLTQVLAPQVRQARGPVVAAVFALLILTIYTYSYISSLDGFKNLPPVFTPLQPFLPLPEEILAPPPQPKDLIDLNDHLYAKESE